MATHEEIATGERAERFRSRDSSRQERLLSPEEIKLNKEFARWLLAFMLVLGTGAVAAVEGPAVFDAMGSNADQSSQWQESYDSHCLVEKNFSMERALCATIEEVQRYKHLLEAGQIPSDNHLSISIYARIEDEVLLDERDLALDISDPESTIAILDEMLNRLESLRESQREYILSCFITLGRNLNGKQTEYGVKNLELTENFTAIYADIETPAKWHYYTVKKFGTILMYEPNNRKENRYFIYRQRQEGGQGLAAHPKGVFEVFDAPSTVREMEYNQRPLQPAQFYDFVNSFARYFTQDIGQDIVDLLLSPKNDADDFKIASTQ